MRESLGGSMLLTLVVIFTSIVILFFVGIIAYSKAYKAKNKIIEVIERYDGNITTHFNDVIDPISEAMRLMGYRVSKPTNCGKDSSSGSCNNLNNSEYNYCICEQPSASAGGSTFEVITYVQFDFPIIGDLLTIPVKGETRVLGKNYTY